MENYNALQVGRAPPTCCAATPPACLAGQGMPYLAVLHSLSVKCMWLSTWRRTKDQGGWAGPQHPTTCATGSAPALLQACYLCAFTPDFIPSFPFLPASLPHATTGPLRAATSHYGITCCHGVQRARRAWADRARNVTLHRHHTYIHHSLCPYAITYRHLPSYRRRRLLPSITIAMDYAPAALWCRFHLL